MPKEETMSEMLDRISKMVPEEEWEKLPKNFSEIAGNEWDFLAWCDCGDAMRYKDETNTYYCLGCDQEYALVKINSPIGDEDE